MDTLLFSPGPVPGEYHFKIDFSHRSQQFEKLYRDCVEGLQYLLPGRDVYLVQGSASAAIEAVLGFIGSRATRIKVLGEGVFADRIRRTASCLNIPEAIAGPCEILCGVQFETSVSRLNDYSDDFRPPAPITICDSVSAFPYYRPPDADVLILSSAKQLRGLPVLGIIAAQMGFFKKFQEKTIHRARTEYFDIPKILRYAERNQTPHTALLPQMLSLRESLNEAYWKPGVSSIDANSAILTYGRTQKIVGKQIAPVITMRCLNPQGLRTFLQNRGIEAYFNSSYMSEQVQFSTFNYDQSEPYEKLNDALKEAEKAGLL